VKAKTAGPGIGCEGLGVALAKKGMRPEGLVGEDVFSAREKGPSYSEADGAVGRSDLLTPIFIAAPP